MLLHNHSSLFLFLHFFFLFYGSTISTHAHPVTDTDGSELSRRKDPPGLDFLKDYKTDLLSAADQGQHSESYNVVNGFVVGDKRVPAIMKVVPDVDKTDNSKTRKEIEFLGKPAVNLLLRWGWDEGRYHIIIKNIRKFDPPLKPLYEHYLEDDKLVALDLLKKARDSVFKRLLEFAEKDNLWRMLRNLPKDYSIDKLEDALLIHGKDLRETDWNRSMSFKGTSYKLQRIAIDQKTQSKTFQITDGFRGKPALLKTFKVYKEADDFRRELREKDLLLDSDSSFDEDWYHFIYKDENARSAGLTSIDV